MKAFFLVLLACSFLGNIFQTLPFSSFSGAVVEFNGVCLLGLEITLAWFHIIYAFFLPSFSFVCPPLEMWAWGLLVFEGRVPRWPCAVFSLFLTLSYFSSFFFFFLFSYLIVRGIFPTVVVVSSDCSVSHHSFFFPFPFSLRSLCIAILHLTFISRDVSICSQPLFSHPLLLVVLRRIKF